MKANDKLKQCLNCKHVSSCWGIDKHRTHKDPANMKISMLARVRLAILVIKLRYVREFQALSMAVYVNTLLPHADVSERGYIVQTSCMVADALVNIPYDGWECPDDVQYEPRA